MSEGKKGQQYAVFAKNLQTNKGVKCWSTKFYELTDELEYWPFKPDHQDAFVERKEYGMKIGDKMVRHYILKMSGSMTKLDEDLKSMGKRLPNPQKRFSNTPNEHDFKAYTLVNEKKLVKAQKSSQKVAKSHAQRSNSEAILAKGVLADKKKVAQKQHINTLKESKESTSVQIDETDNASSGSLDVNENDEKSSTSEVMVCLNCATVASQLDLALSESESFREKYYNLQEKYSNLLKETEALRVEKKNDIQAIKSNVEKLPGIIQKIKEEATTGDCYLKDFSWAVKLEPKFSDFELTSDMVYIGNGKTISKESLYEVGEETIITHKVLKLAELIWPGEVHLRSLSGKSKYKDLKVMKITETERTAIKNILRKLPHDDKISKEDVSKHLKNATNTARSKKFGNVGIVRKKAERKKGKDGKKNKTEEKGDNLQESSDDKDGTDETSDEDIMKGKNLTKKMNKRKTESMGNGDQVKQHSSDMAVEKKKRKTFDSVHLPSSSPKPETSENASQNGEGSKPSESNQTSSDDQSEAHTSVIEHVESEGESSVLLENNEDNEGDVFDISIE